MKDSGKLYVLEKIWKIESPDFKFNKDKFYCALVRPCNVDYKTYRNFLLGKNVKVDSIVHEGCIASWYADKRFADVGQTGPFEKFMVDVNVNKQAFPLIEDWVFEHNWKSYTVKAVDLKTNEVLYDATPKWLGEHAKWRMI